MTGATAKDLLDQHTDQRWRDRFVDIVDLTNLLRDCIIRDNYTVPDAMNAAVALGESGTEMKSRLIRKEQVPVKEAHLMCALALGLDSLFIDVEHTDIEQLAASISDQILSREIRFPFIYGRALYDAFGDAFEDAKDHLTNEETERLLDAVPPGVFQYGRFVVGPSGIRTTTHRRILRFSKNVPAYHCDDPVCRDLHAVVLSTGHNAGINAERGKLERLLRGSKVPGGDWVGLAAEISQIEEAYFGNSWTAPLVTLVGDCLSDSELSVLHARLSESTPLTPLGDRAAFLEDLLVAFEDDTIGSVLDLLVRKGEITVPPGEVRSPVSTAHLRSGVFRLQPQLGANGVRFVSGDPGLPTLRERELFRRIYLAGGDGARDELDWQLRGFDGVSLEVRLDDYLRTVAPPEALTRLVLSGRASAISASELAGAGDFDDADDDVIISRLLWKMGFDDREPEDRHASFWRQHEQLTATVQSWLGTGPGDPDDLKGKASVYFSELEGRLTESLAFAAWSLLFDHTASPRRFTYDPDRDQAVGLELLERFCRSEGASRAGEAAKFTGRLTIHPLIRGFGLLADVLASIRGKQEDFARAPEDFPSYAKLAELQSFPFPSVLPFLDISDHSKTRIISGLAEVESVLMAADVAKVRNEYSHYRRTSPEVVQMVATLEAVGTAVRSIENLGFGLSLYSPAGAETDRWGRRVVRFEGPRSLAHGVSRPSSLQWADLPGLHRNQYLVRAAAFDDANEVLRFVRGYSSGFSEMWVDYPRPKRAVSLMAEGTSGDAGGGSST